MVLSRIILTAFFTIGTVVLAVQLSLRALLHKAVSQSEMVFLLKIIGKKLLLLGGLMPQGNGAIDSISRRQSNVPMNEEEQQQPPPPMTIDQFLSSYTKKQVDLVENHAGLHGNYKSTVTQISANLNQDREDLTHQ
ncbi:hypothetical protein F5877DRAFT_66020 [Lentinula edodes]|nr:hypothetical protein F5877DRAFT_66020 [Lentinula edodes]